MTDDTTLDTFSCAAASLARGEKVTGTGIASTRFLLVEHTGAWEFNAWRGLFGEHPAADAFAEWEPHGGRVQIIRKYGRRDPRPEAAQRVFLVVEGATWQGTWTGLEDLAKIIQADLQHDGLDELMDPYDGPDLTLVCTHAQHDKCCAINGRQVAAALHAVDPEGTWESSHLGGDRFAANVLLFPELLQLGRVPAHNAAEVIAAHRAGQLDLDIVRGVAGLAPAEQYALAHVAAQRQKDYRTLSVHVASSTPESPATNAVAEPNVATKTLPAAVVHTAVVDIPGEEAVTVLIRERQSETPTFNTCRRTKEATYRVLEIH